MDQRPAPGRARHRRAPRRHARGSGRHRPAQSEERRPAAPPQRQWARPRTGDGTFAPQLRIPVGQVYTSMFQRAVETGALMGFGDVTPPADVTEGGLVVTPIETNRRAQAMRKPAAPPPPAGTNVVIVSPKPNIMDAFGKAWFDVREGEASVFKPDGSGHKLVVRVQAGEWSKLAQAASN